MFDLVEIIKVAGYLGIFGIVFAESGIFLGFFLPGDSLLFTAGFLASQGYLDIPLLLLLVFIGAVTGDSVGYWFGEKVGPMIFKRDDSLLFRKDHIKRAHDFFEKHGGKAIVLARFIPAVRTFTPIVAGIGKMSYRWFLFYNIIGGLLWTLLLTLMGYFLGNIIPDADRYLLPIVALIIIISLIPIILQFVKKRK